ncbi:MAG: Na+/H+ antiporter NhaA [Acidimicrobiaceae bacterium]|nr:Na+/H+ antiporter NhaA [Acidimicrobiaceae bacterium]MYG56555.1 Na+/H+ antiporter NhaA [Acidimicrobiaceae bacterium]MYJ97538.1 Na+/H+ antiporter NhaA [Acidimicrobiaceae bacterium]
MSDDSSQQLSPKRRSREFRFVEALGRPLRKFLRIQAAGGILLLGATVCALIWANSAYSDVYHEILETHISIEIGSHVLLDLPIEAWINDALMAIFFFVVGLEIKREFVVGTLRDPRAAALPAIAAIGGMVVPAGIYFFFNPSGMGADGWGIPMATDIAFAVGVVSLLGNRVPSVMKVFLLTLAIVDDIGAIAVIAIFYTSDLSIGWLLAAVAAIFVVIGMRRAGISWTPAYVVVGFFMWFAVHDSGIHATIAGVILGLLAPARPLNEVQPDEEPVLSALRGDANAMVVRRANVELKDQVSVVERLEDLLHPVSSFLIIPIFALANAGIELSTETISDAATSPVTIGIAFGLVFGKLIGVTLATWLSVKSGLTSLPPSTTWTHVVGLAATAGIGFTVSLFIAGLAFSDPLLTEAKIGIVGASLVAAVIGSSILLRAKEVEEIETDDPMLVGTSSP